MLSSPRTLFVTCCVVLAMLTPSAVAADLMDVPDRTASSLVAPAPGYDPHHILVSFHPDVSEGDRALVHARAGGMVVNTLRSIDLDVVALPGGTEAPEAVARYSEMPGVRYAGLNEYLTPLSDSGQEQSLPDDPDFDQQWNLHNEGQSIPDYPVELRPDADIDAPEGWSRLQRIPDRKKIRVAIVDSGFNLRCGDAVEGYFCGDEPDSWIMDNPDLDDVTVAACAGATGGVGHVEEGGCSPDTTGHGSFIAGIIAAETDNGEFVAGIAPDVELALFKFFNYGAPPAHADYFAGLDWATDPQRGDADVITLSIVTPDCKENPIEKAFIDIAEERGIFVVAASGNISRGCVAEGRPASDIEPGQAPAYPSAYDFVMSVGGTNGRGEVWLQDRHPILGTPSNFGTACNETVDILAPAEKIFTTDSDLTNSPGLPAVDEDGLFCCTNRVDGTSMAAPHVAAVAAELLAVTDWSREERVGRLRAALLASATEVAPHPERDPVDCAGLGQVNLAGALEAALESEPVPLDIEIDIKPGTDDNQINTKSAGSIPVAVLSTDTFDAPSSVDIPSVAFGPAGAGVVRTGVEDVDGDGQPDLVLHFDQQRTGLGTEDFEACLAGATRDGQDIRGCDAVSVK